VDIEGASWRGRARGWAGYRSDPGGWPPSAACSEIEGAEIRRPEGPGAGRGGLSCWARAAREPRITTSWARLAPGTPGRTRATREVLHVPGEDDLLRHSSAAKRSRFDHEQLGRPGKAKEITHRWLNAANRASAKKPRSSSRKKTTRFRQDLLKDDGRGETTSARGPFRAAARSSLEAGAGASPEGIREDAPRHHRGFPSSRHLAPRAYAEQWGRGGLEEASRKLFWARDLPIPGVGGARTASPTREIQGERIVQARTEGRAGSSAKGPAWGPDYMAPPSKRASWCRWSGPGSGAST